jgi:hypothetical protein
MRPHMRRIVMGLAYRHVRRLSLESADRLMGVAATRRLSHKGNRDWLVARKGEYESCYLVPMPDIRLRSSDTRCILVLLDRKNRAVWMSVDVSPWKVLRLPKLRRREVVASIGRLAANCPVVQWDGSLSR